MGRDSLVVIENEIIEIELVAIFRLNPPVEESAEGVTLHEAVEEPVNLFRSPYELPLDGGQHEIMRVYDTILRWAWEP